jgi:ribosome-binding factor A
MAKAKVTITGDSKDAQKAMDGLSKKSGKLKNSLKKAGKMAAVGLAAGI